MENAQRLAEITEQLNEIVPKYREAQNKLREIRLGRKKAMEEAILSKKREEAERKLREGKRLTIEDLKVLYGLEDEEAPSA
jgi:uncharacterized coiled-coil DUF342 family protein